MEGGLHLLGLHDLLIMDPCRSPKLRTPRSGARGDVFCHRDEGIITHCYHGVGLDMHEWYCCDYEISKNHTTREMVSGSMLPKSRVMPLPTQRERSNMSHTVIPRTLPMLVEAAQSVAARLTLWM